MVTVKNYNSNNEVSQILLNYEVNVISTDGSELPEYYFTDLNGNNLGTTARGTLGNTIKEEKVYKLIFVNVANEEITRNIKVVAIASQD